MFFESGLSPGLPPIFAISVPTIADGISASVRKPASRAPSGVHGFDGAYSHFPVASILSLTGPLTAYCTSVHRLAGRASMSVVLPVSGSQIGSIISSLASALRGQHHDAHGVDPCRLEADHVVG